MSMKTGVPIQANGVAIDLLSVRAGEDHLASALDAPMGSIIGAATFPLAVWLVQHAPFEAVAASLIAATFIIYRHSSNIQRLRDGTENVFKL